MRRNPYSRNESKETTVELDNSYLTIMGLKNTLFLILLCQASISFQEEFDDCESVILPVKRLHSRHRRFIAPGSRWDWLGGWETYSENFNIEFYILIRYSMDYFFGGFSSYAAELAGNDAAALALKATKEAVNAATGAKPNPAAQFGKKKGQWNSTSESNSKPGRRVKRSLVHVEGNVDNVLTRTVAHDQVEIFKRIEDAFTMSGYPGHSCLLKIICELHETPVGDKHIVGEMVTNFFSPKDHNLDDLEKYRVAREVGGNEGDCESTYPDCEISVFNLVPRFDPDNEDIVVTFDPVEASTTTRESIDDIERSMNAKKLKSLNLGL